VPAECLGGHQLSYLTDKQVQCTIDFGWWFTSTPGTCASSSRTHVLHACWGITSFPPQCQTAPESEFRWTVDRVRRPSQLAYTISWPQSGFFAVGTRKRLLVYSAPITDLELFMWRAVEDLRVVCVRCGCFRIAVLRILIPVMFYVSILVCMMFLSVTIFYIFNIHKPYSINWTRTASVSVIALRALWSSHDLWCLRTATACRHAISESSRSIANSEVVIISSIRN
jgi:hypothetical protein